MATLTLGQKLDARREAGMVVQSKINAMAAVDPAAALTMAICCATTATADFPQYAGRYEGWCLAVIRKDYRSKSGLGFRKGDWALYDCEDYQEDGSSTCFSLLTGHECSVPGRYFDQDGF